MNQNFIYLNWDTKNNRNDRLKFHKDKKCSVEVQTSVGPYKNNYANIVLEKNNVYYWEIKIIKGNYFKIGVIKFSAIADLKGKAFSDIAEGYAYYSPGKLRNGSCSTGSEFGTAYGPGDTVKVEFNSKTGTLSFGKNEEPLKVGFSIPDFKKGGYTPAISGLIEGSKYCVTLPDMQD